MFLKGFKIIFLETEIGTKFGDCGGRGEEMPLPNTA